MNENMILEGSSQEDIASTNIISKLGLGRELNNLYSLGFDIKDIHTLWLSHVKQLWAKAHPDKDMQGKFSNLLVLLKSVEDLQDLDTFEYELRTLNSAYSQQKSEINEIKRDYKNLKSQKREVEKKLEESQKELRDLKDQNHKKMLEQFRYIDFFGRPMKSKKSKSIIDPMSLIGIQFRCYIAGKKEALNDFNLKSFESFIVERGLATAFISSDQDGWRTFKNNNKQKKDYIDVKVIPKIVGSVRKVVELVSNLGISELQIHLYRRNIVSARDAFSDDIILGSVDSVNHIENISNAPNFYIVPALQRDFVKQNILPYIEEGRLLISDCITNLALFEDSRGRMFEYELISHIYDSD